jgi:molybdate transport system permease protein
VVDWQALRLSLALGAWTLALLLPLAVLLGRWLAVHEFRGKGFVEAVLALPLVLPPTVLGYYLLVGMGAHSPLGQAVAAVAGRPLAFSFEGLVLASVVANLPFAVQPIQRGFEAVPRQLREAAACCGMPPWRRLRRVELPLAWPGILTGAVLTFAHTLGEFGVVLMVGGSIPGETKTVAIAIYDRVQAFDDAAAGRMALVLLAVSLAAIAASYAFAPRAERRHG